MPLRLRCGSRAKPGWLVARTVPPHGVHDSGKAPSKRGHGNHLSASLLDLCRPGYERIVLAEATEVPGGLGERPSHPRRTSFGDACAAFACGARVFAWYEAEIALHGVRIGEALDLVEGSNEA